MPAVGGGFLIADWGNNVVRKVSPAGIISTVAGNGQVGNGGDGGSATGAQHGAERGGADEGRWVPDRLLPLSAADLGRA